MPYSNNSRIVIIVWDRYELKYTNQMANYTFRALSAYRSRQLHIFCGNVCTIYFLALFLQLCVCGGPSNQHNIISDGSNSQAILTSCQPLLPIANPRQVATPSSGVSKGLVLKSVVKWQILHRESVIRFRWLPLLYIIRHKLSPFCPNFRDRRDQVVAQFAISAPR